MPPTESPPSHPPLVSVLVAARNEETNIIGCLEAIHRLGYPAERLQVLIGNDQSEDRTGDLIREFIRDKPHFRCYDITGNVGGQRGKSNVLAQLIRRAKGEFYFFTDADVRVPPGWIEALLAGHQSEEGVVTGVTTVGGSRLFDRLQALDWLFALAAVKGLADWHVPVTAMGNNLMVSRTAYLATGGYENLPFSVVEDTQLFWAIVRRGYGFRHVYQTTALARTQPAPTLTALLHQRKRWMRGAMQLPGYLVVLLFVQALFTPGILGLACFFPTPALAIFVVKTGAQGWFMWRTLRRLHQSALDKYLLFYPVYEAGLSLLLIAFYYLPFGLEWKGRKYD
ncbi:MAG: glycosyltransferase [Ferruginibacter sp.]|nr:glycosyltransferase [Cytophagales bacterium]